MRGRNARGAMAGGYDWLKFKPVILAYFWLFAMFEASAEG
jgi:hypothetical protein